MYVYTTAKSTNYIGEGGSYGDGTQFHLYHCDFCNNTFEGDNPWHAESTFNLTEAKNRSDNNYGIQKVREYVCNMDTNTVVGYAPNCGYSHGQILGAYIDYSGNKNVTANKTASYLNTSLMSRSSALESLEDFDFDGYLNGDMSDFDDLYYGFDDEDEFAQDFAETEYVDEEDIIENSDDAVSEASEDTSDDTEESSKEDEDGADENEDAAGESSSENDEKSE